MALSSPIVSLVTESSGSNELTSLFSKTVKKTAPEYDYSSVPERKNKNKESPAVEKSNEGNNEEDTELLNESKEIQKHSRLAQVKHEDSKPRKIDPETEARTVFVGNLPSSVKKQTVLKLFSKLGKVETVRFRSAARPDLKTTKKVAVIKQKFHDERSNINAYVRMSTIEEAEAACSLNNSILDTHTIRVDMALKDKIHDNKKSVFLGNLDFKCHEEDVRKLFSKCGEIEGIRLVRDSATGIGKGFGYVNFSSEDSVGLAIRLNNQEISGRKIRVSRAVRKFKGDKGMKGNVAQQTKSQNKEKKVFSKKHNHDSKEKKLDRTKQRANRKSQKTDVKSFQGLSGVKDKKIKKSLNKTQLKNKAMAKKLSS